MSAAEATPAAPAQVTIGKIEAGPDDDAKVDKEQAICERAVLTISFVNDVYWYAAKCLGTMVGLMLILVVPMWVLPSFLRSGFVWSAQEFKDACAANADNELEDEATAKGLALARRLIISIGMCMILFTVRAEYMQDERTAEEAQRVRRIRYWYYVPAVLMKCVQMFFDITQGMKDPDIRNNGNPMVYNLLLLMSFCSVIIGSAGYIQQSVGLDKPWFQKRCTSIFFTIGFVFCFLLCVIAGTFAKQVLANENQNAAFIGQVVIILVANLLEMGAKQLFVHSAMDPGLLGCFQWSLTCSFKLAIRTFTFVRADFPSLVMAILLSFSTQVAGQISNFVKWTFCQKGGPVPHVQRINDVMFLHELAASHVSNVTVFIMLMTSDVRYWMTTTSVGVDQQYNKTLIVAGFLMAELFEFMHDAIMCKLVVKSQPNSNIPAMAKSSRACKVIMPFAVATLVVGAVVSAELRITCLMCGTAIPTKECYVAVN